MSKSKLVVLISGGGTNLQALIDACENGTLNAEISLVVSNKKAAYGLTRAEKAGIPTLYFPLGAYKKAGHSRDDYNVKLAQRIAEYEPDLVVLAGWMLVISADFLSHFPNRVINLHPALPDMFDGVNAIERAYASFRRGEITHSGVMVHVVTDVLDGGPLVRHAIIKFEETDTLETFAARMHQAEHKVIVEGTQTMLDLLP